MGYANNTTAAVPTTDTYDTITTVYTTDTNDMGYAFDTANNPTATVHTTDTYDTIATGEPMEYSGPREAKGIVAWLEKKTGPQFHLITEKKKLDKALEEKHAIAVGFFKDLDSKASKIFQEVAGALDDISFYIVTEPSLMTELSQNDGAILLLKTFDDKEAHFKGTVTKDGLQKFIETSARPLVSEFTQENAAKIFSSEIQKHFLLLSAKADKEFESRIGIVSVQCALCIVQCALCSEKCAVCSVL